MKKYARDTEEIEPQMIELMFTYLEKLRELESYYEISPTGYIQKSQPLLAKTTTSKKSSSKKDDTRMMMGEESMMNSNYNGKMIKRANYHSGDFMNVFGSTDRSAPDTNVETKATMKQILKMINSPECHSITKKDSFLMKELAKREKLSERISYLYYTIYGRW